MKKRIFIGSSSEQLATLNQVVDLVGNEAECIPWTNAFGLNKSALDSLIKQTRLSDFAILIATKDDITKMRGDELTTPRDNVIFEFGLFLGSAGTEKCYLLAEEGADLPSDLDGITVAKFSREPDRYNSLNKIVENIIAHVKRSASLSELGLLPSTALAIGYYNSFVKRLCEELHRTESIVINDKKVSVKSFRINVIIPEMLDDNGVSDFALLYNKKNNLNKASTYVDLDSKGVGRGYPFHFKVDPPQEDLSQQIDIHISDIPTTLSTIVECIKLFIPSREIGTDFDLDYIEKRELENFAMVLKYLISKNSATKGYVELSVNVNIDV